MKWVGIASNANTTLFHRTLKVTLADHARLKNRLTFNDASTSTGIPVTRCTMQVLDSSSIF